MNAQNRIIDFGKSSGGGNWYITNDGVMGGLSQGRAFLTDSSVIFLGDISLENNGGFSSLRQPYQGLDLNTFKEIEVKFRTNGFPFSITLSKSRRFFIPNYKQLLPVKENEWMVFSFSINDLKEYRLGNPTGRAISKNDIQNLIGLSFFNENKIEGDFLLEVDYILFR